MDKSKKALVKGIQSGDCVILSGKLGKGDNIPEEHTIYLTGVIAPKNGFSNHLEEDPYGWEARNHLRKLFNGKIVTYNIDYTANERQYGQIVLEGKNAGIEMVKSGLARVGYLPKGNEALTKSEYFTSLTKCEEEAKKSKLGQWSGDAPAKHKRALHLITDIDFDLEPINNAIKEKKALSAMIDYVFNCSFVSVFFPDFNVFAKFNLRFVAIPNAKDQGIYKAGKAYLERMSLHQDVKALIVSVDESKNLMGDIVAEKGNLAELVLKSGYAKIFVNNSTPYALEELKAIKLLQEQARAQKLGVWVNEAGSEIKEVKKDDNDEIGEAKCIQVHSGDSISVKAKKGNIIRIFLSNVKAPALAKPNTTEDDQPWAFQAKEYLRKQLVGKTVKCDYDYTKITPKDNRVMKFYTVYYTVDNQKHKDFGKEKCANEGLLENGLANIALFKVDEGEPSKRIDSFKLAEASAKEKKQGLYSGKFPGQANYSDLISAPKSKKKDFISFINGLKDLQCTVEYCFSGFKLKLRIESKQCMIAFSMLGIRTFTKDKNNTDLHDKYYKLAVDYVNEVILQRDGVCDIVNADRIGNYFGHFFFNGKNFAIDLVSKGLAVVVESGSVINTYQNELKAAEKEAEKNKLGIWASEGLSNILKGETSSMTSGKAFEEVHQDVKLRVTEYIDFHNFYVNILPNQALTKIDSVLAAYDKTPSKRIKLEAPVKNGTLCAAKYPVDDKYYRAVIQTLTKEGKYKVEFIDYGTIEYLPIDNLIKLDGSISSFGPQCMLCELAYLKYSQNSMNKAVEKYLNLADLDLEYQAKIAYKYSVDGVAKAGVVIYQKPSNLASSHHAEFLSIGYAKLDRKQKIPDYLKQLDEFEAKADEKGLGLWAENEETDYDYQYDEDFNY